MALATLSIDLVAKLGELQAGMDKAGRIAEKSAAQIESRFAAIKGVAAGVGQALAAAFSVEALRQFFQTTVNGLDALNDLADATGSTIENLSGLEDAAARTGTSLEVVGTALIKLNKFLAEAKPGNAQALALQSIGLEAEALKKLDPADALLKVSKALSGYADDNKKADFVSQAFGKTLREVAPLLKDLADNGKIVATVTAQQAAEAEKFNKALANLQKNTTDVARSIVSDLLPAINQYLETFKRAREDGGRTIFAELQSEVESLRLAFLTSKIEDLTGALRADPGNDGLSKALRQAREDYDRLSRSAAAANERLKATIGIQLPTEYSNEGRNAPKPSIPEPEDPKIRQAKLSALLADFQRQYGLTAAAIGASEQTLQASRGANLLADRAYYAAKKALLKADETAQVSALQSEIAALQDYRAKVGNTVPEEQQIALQRQIADKAAQVAQVRIKAGAALAALNLQERRDLEQVSIAFQQAQSAAEVYLAKLFEAQQQDLAGQSQGDAQRRRNEGILQIERDYKSELEALDQQRIAGRFNNDQSAYNRELQLIEDTRAKALAQYEDYYAKLEALQANGAVGAQRAIENYFASAKNVAAQVETAYTNAFRNLEDTLVQFVQTGKLNFKGLADSIIAEFLRIQIKAQLFKIFGGKKDGGDSGSALGSIIGAIFGEASQAENPVSGSIIRGRRAMGGPIQAGLPYLVGERGPEVVIPRTAGTVIPNGKGVGASTTINYAPVFQVSGPVPQETLALVRAEVNRSQQSFARQLRMSGAIT